MSKKVLENIAAKYQNLQKEVKEIMSGRILDYEGRNIFYEGIELGKCEANVETAKRLRKDGMTDTQREYQIFCVSRIHNSVFTRVQKLTYTLYFTLPTQFINLSFDDLNNL